MQLMNATAWITGAGKRLGRAIALELARRGCNLVIHYGSSVSEAHEVAKTAEEMGRRTLVFKADLSQVEEIKSLGRSIEAEFGGLDILINAAANFERVKFEDVTEAQWDFALDLNLKGAAFCAMEAARLMRLKRNQPTTDSPLFGKIINFADWSALRPYRNYLPYMVSKGGVVTLTQALALELAPEITVNSIAPGTVLPPAHTSEAELEKIAANVPLRRIGSPEDIVCTVTYLLESDYVTGQIICVDGGRFVAQPSRS